MAYLVTVHAKLFSIHRIVEANSKTEAAAKVDQTGARVMWIEDVTAERDSFYDNLG